MKITKRQLRNIIQEVLDEVEFHGETPAGQLYGTEKEDAKFTQQLAVEKILKSAGLDREEMNIVFGVLADRLDELDFLDSSAYEKLFQHFAFSDSGESEMPYGVAKARTGDPGHWILNKLRGLGAGPGAEPKSLKNPPQYGGWDPFNTGRSSRRPPGPGRSRFRRESLTREKITKKELQKIIKEELENFLETNESPSREECEGLLGASGGYKPENPRELETMQRCKDTHPDLGKGKRE